VTPFPAKVSDLRGFLKVVFPYGDCFWVYRGQPDGSRPLLPKAGRPEFYDEVYERYRRDLLARKTKKFLLPKDLARFNVWSEQAVAYCDLLPENNFERLAYAQHYGLATRLLDWTSNPLVALFFAAESRDKHNGTLDGAVFAYAKQPYLDPKRDTFQSIQRVTMYEPRPFDRRLLMQDALFTYHPEPNVALVARIQQSSSNLIKIGVAAKSKDMILSELSGIGISRKRLFPDLEGLSMFVNWETERAVEARNRSELPRSLA